MTRFVPLVAALALAAIACEPSVPKRQNPQTADYAVFDPTKNEIPQPNDLALQAAATTPGAAGELLRMFNAAGGFPNDQEVPVTIDFVHQTIQNGKLIPSAPDLDFTSFVPCTASGAACSMLFLRVDVPPPDGGPKEIEVKSENYVKGTDRGTLSMRNPLQPLPSAPAGTNCGASPQSCSRRWPTKTGATGAHYILALRGGPNGIKTSDGSLIYAQPAMFLLTQGKDLTDPRNQGGLLTAAQGQQLELIRRSYSPVFAAVSTFFPVDEIADLTTFTIAPSTGATFIETDASAGLVPLPFDLLLDRSGTTPHVIFSESFGPAAAGLATLDGFSTTAMILAETSAPIVASTVAPGVLLFDLSNPANPAQVPPLGASGTPGYLAEPPTITQAVGGTEVSTAIGLQPAVLVGPPSIPSPVPLPPLKEATEYAVVMTDAVTDTSRKKLATSMASLPATNSTLSLLFFQNPLFANGKSQVPGVSDVQAQSLEAMRTLLPAVVAKVKAAGQTPVAAYTFRTQSITGRTATAAGGGTGPSGAIQLAALPYDSTKLKPLCAGLGAALKIPNLDCTKPIPGTTKVYTTTGGTGTAGTVADVVAKYGVETTAQNSSAAPTSHIAEIIETQIATINLLDPATGAFVTDPTKATPEVINVLVAVPALSATPACTGSLAALGTAGVHCAPLVVFHHGVTVENSAVVFGGRADMLLVADTFANAGAVVAAIDMAKHGDRSWCSQVNGFVLSGDARDPNFECLDSVCVPDPKLANQGDVLPSPSSISPTPGHCQKPDGSPGAFRNRPTLCVSGTCSFTVGGQPAPNPGIPFASGDFLISTNFFRTRDTLRQDIIDQSQLVQVVAPTPTGSAIAGADVYNQLLAGGIVVDPTATFWVGQSLGAITGTLSTAANPRFSRSVLNVGGGTIVDAVTTAPAFATPVAALFASLGIDITSTDPIMRAKLLQTVNVAKWVLDPADPINFALHVRQDPLPNLLPPLGGNTNGSVAQSPKDVLAQIALCDTVVPNPENELLAGLIGLSPISAPSTSGSDLVEWFEGVTGADAPSGAAYPSGCSSGAPQGFFTSWGSVASLTSKGQANAADFLLVHPGSPQPTLVTP